MKALVLAALFSAVPTEPPVDPPPPPPAEAAPAPQPPPAPAPAASPRPSESEETPPVPSTVEPVEPAEPPVLRPPEVAPAPTPPPAVPPPTPSEPSPEAEAEAPLSPPEVPPYEPPEPPHFGTKFRAATELSVLSLGSGTPDGGQDGFAVLTPLFGVESGDDFAFELGASLRLRLLDAPPLQRGSDYEQLLRREDWDERGDFGQLLRSLKLGADGAAFSLRAGPLGQYTLGRGHVVSRYSNRQNPDYLPAGAVLTVSTGPVRVEALASDVLAARVFAVEAALDVARFFGALEEQHDRYHAAITAAHDAGASGPGTPALTLMALDADAQLYRGKRLRLFAHGAVGTRLGEAEPTVGVLLGATGDWDAGPFRASGRVEVRTNVGRFRHGMIGSGYELQRFADVGLFAPAIGATVLPFTLSPYAELAFTTGADADVFADRPQLTAGFAAEQLADRVDWDANLQLRLGHAAVKVRTGVAGMFQQPRFTLGAEGRYRFAPSFYALATVGTTYFPQPDGSLARGVAVSAGAAIDFER